MEIIRPIEPCHPKRDALLHALHSLIFPINFIPPATADIFSPIDTESNYYKVVCNTRKPWPSGALQVNRLMDRNMSSDNMIAGVPV